MLPLACLALALNWRRLKTTPLVLGTFLGVLSFTPYLWAQWQIGWRDVQAVIEATRRPAMFDLEAVRIVLGMVGGPTYQNSTGVSSSRFVAGMPDFIWLYNLEICLLVGGLVYLVWAALVDTKLKQIARLLLAWGIIPTIMLTRHSLELSPHYLLPVFPMQFLAIGALANQLFHWDVRQLIGSNAGHLISQVTRTCLALAVAAITVTQVYAFSYYVTFVQREDTTGGLEYTLKDTMAALGQAEKIATEAGGNLWIAVTGYDFPEVFTFLARGKPSVGQFDSRHTLVLPKANTIMPTYLTINSSDYAGELLSQNFTIAGSSGVTGHPNYFRMYQPGPQSVTKVFEKEGVTPMSWMMANGIQISGAALPRRVTPGDVIRLVIRWETPDIFERRPDHVFALALLDEYWQASANTDVVGLPSNQWLSGQIILNRFELRTSMEVPAGLYWIGVASYTRPSVQRVAFLDNKGVESGTVRRIGPIKITSPAGVSLELPSSANRQVVDFGGRIRLLGFDAPFTQPGDGQPLVVRLYWQTVVSMKEDYSIFVHLLNGDDKIVAQNDHQPKGGMYPTSVWDPGEVVADEFSITLPDDLAAGQYRLAIGMYLLSTGERLPAGPQNNRVLLYQTITVAPRP
jgi:hypothetical protein